jgi:hypothetical protein
MLGRAPDSGNRVDGRRHNALLAVGRSFASLRITLFELAPHQALEVLTVPVPSPSYGVNRDGGEGTTAFAQSSGTREAFAGT